MSHKAIPPKAHPLLVRPLYLFDEAKLRFLRYLPVLLLGFLAALLLLSGLGQSSLRDWDEAIHAQISKEMIQSGEWLVPYHGYEPYFNKPPLLHWSTALFYLVFGINEFWARAASALSGVVLICITYLIGQHLYDKIVGFIATLVLLSAYLFVRQARWGTPDAILALFIYLAIYGYIQLKDGNPKWWYLIWISFGLAVMTKGAGAMIIPATIALMLVFDRDVITKAWSPDFFLGILAGLIIAAPWHIIMYIKHGPPFLEQYLFEQTFARIATVLASNDDQGRGSYYYVYALQLFFSPWFYLIPFAVAISIKENIENQVRSRPLLLLIVLVFGLYTIVRTKLPWYILPLLPACAILIAFMIKKAYETHRSAAFIGLFTATLLAALIINIKLAVLLSGFGLILLIFFLSTRRKVAYPSAVILMFIFLMVIGFCSLFGKGGLPVSPLYGRGDTPAATLARLAGKTDSNSSKPIIGLVLATSDTVEGPAILFYSNRPTRQTYSLDGLRGLIQGQEERNIIMAEKLIPSLSADYQIQIMAKVEPLVYATIKKKSQ